MLCVQIHPPGSQRCSQDKDTQPAYTTGENIIGTSNFNFSNIVPIGLNAIAPHLVITLLIIDNWIAP